MSSITFDAASTAPAEVPSGTNTVTSSHVMGSGSNAIIVGAFMVNLVNTPSATFNSVAMTSAGALDWDSTFRIQLFYLVAPAAGTRDLVCSCIDHSGGMYCGAVSFFGVHQTTPIGVVVSSGADVNPISVDVPSAPGEVVVDFTFVVAPASITASQTQRWQSHFGSNTYAQQTAPGASLVTMSWSWTGGTTRSGIIAMTLKPAGTTADMMGASLM